MRFSQQTAFVAAAAAAFILPSAFAQTYTKCNPLQATCPADPALGGSRSVDFTQGSSDASSNFDGASGTGVAYDSTNGLALTVASQGQAPTLTSKWYIMFGRVEVTMKAAPGTGIVSSAVMQSDDLDEIDWEWLGGDASQVQSNYFGKGITGGYNRGAFHADPTSQSEFTTYTVDWSAEQVVWSINGQTVRVLSASAAGDQFPQSPMQVKLGVWAGGDPSNAPGTISWAGGQTDYSQGPFTMYVKSVSVTDYSTGSEYKYGDNSGSWQSIVAVGGTVVSTSPSGTVASAPSVTAATSGQPSPFSGTHAEGSSTYVVPSIYPWVGTASSAASTDAPCYTGLPSGWTCSSNGKALPPSSAPVSTHTLFSSSFTARPATAADTQPSQSTSPAASSTSSPAASPSAPLSSASGVAAAVSPAVTAAPITVTQAPAPYGNVTTLSSVSSTRRPARSTTTTTTTTTATLTSAQQFASSATVPLSNASYTSSAPHLTFTGAAVQAAAAPIKLAVGGMIAGVFGLAVM